MALQGSGAISIYDINIELSYAGTRNTNLNESALRTLAGVPSGAISLSNFYGKSSWIYTVNRGWNCGGLVTGSSSNTISRMEYSTEVNSNIAATLVTARSNLCANHSTTRGYTYAGWTGAASAEIDGIVLATEAANNPAAVLATAKQQPMGTLSEFKGFVMGGYNPYASIGIIEGLVFSSESAFTLSAVLATARYAASSGQNATKGYVIAGYNYGSTPPESTEIDGILFSNETAVNPSAAATSALSHTASVNSDTKIYTCGGKNTNTLYTEIMGLDMSSETAINPSAVLSVARMNSTGLSTKEQGYICGGQNGATFYTEIDGILFSNESATNTSAALPATRYAAAAFSGIAR